MLIFGINYFASINFSNEFDRSLFIYATNNSSGSLQSQAGGNNANNSSSSLLASSSNGDQTNMAQMMTAEEEPFFCGNKTLGSNYYVNEYETPIPCSHPVGLAADKDNNIWVASGWSGNILVFDPTTNTFVKTMPIPNWPQQQGSFGSMIWAMKFDKNGDLWFTDQKTNSIWKYFTKEGKFENYRILTEGGYPLSLVFDSSNNVWYTQVFGKSLGFLEPAKVMNNTTEGISELDLSQQIDFQTMGPISNGFKFADNKSNKGNLSDALWFTTDSYPIGGQLIKFNITKQSLTIHDLTHTNSIPISVAEDENGNLWTNNHASSIFIMLNPPTGETKQHATSFPATANPVTLPYVNEYRDGKIWFNEHYGNAIASYDISNKTLVEYHIPSINAKWGNASNPLRFIFDNNGSVWFTEWTENKLGVIPKEKHKPSAHLLRNLKRQGGY